MPTINELRKIRLKKLEAVKRAGINPYPIKTKRTHSIEKALLNFERLVKTKTNLVLVGRIRSIREHGGSTFLHFEDGTGSLQAYFKRDKLGEKNYKFFLDNFDIGDFIEVRGILFKTRKEEKTIEATAFKILAKSLLPLPEKWHGLKDVEERFRKRYLDLIMNPEVKKKFEIRSKIIKEIREFLEKEGFLEVETPILQPIYGGAKAKPFKTHLNALNLDLYLRIAPELYLKRLLVGGFEKVYEIGRVFRNEGMDSEHLQDYTHMEFYWAYADYEQGMKFVEEMYKYIAEKTFGTLKFKIKDFNVDFGKKWEKYDYVSIIAKHTGVNIDEANLAEIEKTLQKLKIDYDKNGFNITRGIDNLWKYCRKNISGPGFLINVPVVMEPLAKRMEKNPKLVQRFQVILAGSENGKGYSELNDPIDQAKRFKEQQKLRDAGDQEAQRYDKDFIEALEYGMPPTCGFGVSERLFSFLMDKPSRDCQIFPLMRPK